MGWVLEYLLWKLPQHCGNQLVDGLSSNSSFFSLAYLGLHLFVFSCFFFSGGSWREAVGFDARITSFRLKT